MHGVLVTTDRLLSVRDVGLPAVRVTECAERVRVNWCAVGPGTWRADVVTVSDDGLIPGGQGRRLRPAGPGERGSCRIVAWRAAGGLLSVSRTWLWSRPGCRAGGVPCPRPPSPVWL